MKNSQNVMQLICICLFVVTLAFPANADAEFFGMKESKQNSVQLFPKWTNMLKEYKQESEICTDGNCNSDWKAFINQNKNKSDKIALLDKVNNFINKVAYKDDNGDKWASPAEFMKNGGDCEDYAIAKYMLLKEMGVSSSDMRVVVLNDSLKGQMHAVLQVDLVDDSYILDIEAPKIFRISDNRHYSPLYAINEKNWWLYQKQENYLLTKN